LSSIGSTPDQQKYHVDGINEPTLCTLLYVKGRTLRTIEVADTIVMATRIMHGQPILLECAVVEVTMIREGHEFVDLDYLDEEEGIEKMEKLYGGLNNYKTKKLLEDLALVGMIVEGFWQHGDEAIQEFEYGKPLVPKHVHLKLLWIM
jgi:hypothetical protein